MSTTRRDFLKQAGTLSVCACCMGPSAFISSCSSVKGITGTETADAVRIPIASFKDSGTATITTKKFPDPIYVTKKADGNYTAVLLNCTHKGGPLNVAGDKFVCSWHKSEFAINGDLLKGPATTGLKTFKAEEEKQMVVVHFM